MLPGNIVMLNAAMKSEERELALFLCYTTILGSQAHRLKNTNITLNQIEIVSITALLS